MESGLFATTKKKLKMPLERCWRCARKSNLASHGTGTARYNSTELLWRGRSCEFRHGRWEFWYPRSGRKDWNLSPTHHFWKARWKMNHSLTGCSRKTLRCPHNPLLY